MRFLLGDLKREGKVKADNKFGVEVRTANANCQGYAATPHRTTPKAYCFARRK